MVSITNLLTLAFGTVIIGAFAYLATIIVGTTVGVLFGVLGVASMLGSMWLVGRRSGGGGTAGRGRTSKGASGNRGRE